MNCLNRPLNLKTGYVTGVHQWTPETGNRHYSFRYGNKDANEMPDQVYGVSLNGVEKQSYSFDNLGRLLTKTVNVSAGKNITYSYEYKDVGDNGTTTVVETFVNDFGTYVYEYDKNGNITKETFTPKNNKDTEEQEEQEEAKVTVYEYDKLGQLKLVTINGSDRYAYYYDASGNISNISYVDEAGGEHYPWYKYENANWRDQLTSFNGEAITYDEIGNPLSYRGATLTWQNGRQLAKYQKGSMIAEYKYDGNGNRISKTHNGNTYEFIYNGSNLVAMTNTGTTLFNWICDENGDYLGFTYCGVEYYYIRNLQNDVIGIKNPSGTVVVEYEYDPFGKVIATTGPLADTLGKLNPIRYRGYFYDTETGFYFLKSRYYDPETCRFINADGYVSTGQGILGYNMYAYCNNNPVMYSDPSGMVPKWLSPVLTFVSGILKKFPQTKRIGEILEDINKGTKTVDNLSEIDDTLKKTEQIKEQYVNDIALVGSDPDAYIKETPSEFVFPDVEAYNTLCREQFDSLVKNPNYSNVTGTSFNMDEAKNTMLTWDRSNTMDLVAYTFYKIGIKVFVEFVRWGLR